MPDPAPAAIFFAYAREDADAVRKLAESLQGLKGWSVFWDHKIPPGRVWLEVLEEALRGSKCVIVAWSRHSINSRWVKREATEGLDRNILVPVLLDSVDPPFGFRDIQAADISGWSGNSGHPGFESLIAAVQRVLELSGQVSNGIGDSPKPDVGPASVQEIKPGTGTHWNRRRILAAACSTAVAGGIAGVFWYRRRPLISIPSGSTRRIVRRRGPWSVATQLPHGFYLNPRSGIVHVVLMSGRIGHVASIREAALQAIPMLQGSPANSAPQRRVHLSAASQAFEDAALEFVRQRRHDAAIQLLGSAISHDLQLQRRSGNRPSLRLYDLYAGLLARYGERQQLQALVGLLPQGTHASLFASRAKSWSDPNSSWSKGWSKPGNGKRWGGLPM